MQSVVSQMALEIRPDRKALKHLQHPAMRFAVNRSQGRYGGWFGRGTHPTRVLAT